MSRREKQRVYGVDFSGAQSAGDKIWLASGIILDEEVFIEGCFRGRDLPGGTRDRGEALQALRRFIHQRPGCAFGLDFPFGLPEGITNDYASWEAFVRDFPSVYDDPDDFYEKCKEAGRRLPTDRIEHKRGTDESANAPFSPYNIRIKNQTFYGIANVLAPLVEDEKARVLPMQPQTDDLPRLIEVCPSSTLNRLNLPRSGYKDNDENAAATRRRILDGLEEAGIHLPSEIHKTAVNEPEGDSVDSIVAAFATADNAAADTMCYPGKVEGHIYI